MVLFDHIQSPLLADSASEVAGIRYAALDAAARTPTTSAAARGIGANVQHLLEAAHRVMRQIIEARVLTEELQLE